MRDKQATATAECLSGNHPRSRNHGRCEETLALSFYVEVQDRVVTTKREPVRVTNSSVIISTRSTSGTLVSPSRAFPVAGSPLASSPHSHL